MRTGVTRLIKLGISVYGNHIMEAFYTFVSKVGTLRDALEKRLGDLESGET